jgi:hypothetical protein
MHGIYINIIDAQKAKDVLQLWKCEAKFTRIECRYLVQHILLICIVHLLDKYNKKTKCLVVSGNKWLFILRKM